MALLLAGLGTASGQQLSLQRYGKPEGLDNVNLNCLLQAHDGYLWACTENGFFRYDGKRFQRFGEREGLENTLVYAAAEDRLGRLWVATSSDVYVGEAGRFRPVRPEGTALRATQDATLTALPGGDIALVARNRALRLSAAGPEAGWRGRPMFTPAQVAALPELEELAGLYVAPDGHLWLGCGQKICDLVDGRVASHARPDGVPPDRWQGFVLDAEGGLWARGRTQVLRLKKGETRFVAEPLTDAHLRNSLDTTPIIAAADGSVVMRTHSGFARWHDGRWSRWTPTNGLPSPDVTALQFDREGALWVGLVGRGAARLVGYGRIESWTHEQGLGSDIVWSLVRVGDHGPLLAATNASCRSMERGSARFGPCRLPGIPPGEIGAMVRDPRGTLWVGFRAGELWVLEPGARAARFVAKLPHFTSMLVDSRGRLWVPTRAGVFLRAPGESALHLVGEAHEFLDAAEDAQGGVWIAGSDGLLRYADGAWTHAELALAQVAPGFSSVAIGRDGSLWAASRSRGVLHAVLDGTRLREAAWIEDPLVANASPMFVRIDAAQRVWIGTDYGVVVQAPRAAVQAGQPAWQRLTESDGLVWNDVNQSSFLADADGSVWIGTSGGLSHVVDPARALAREPLKLELVNGLYAGRHFTPAGRHRWDWSRAGALDLDLVCLNFARSFDSVFRYRIVGVDPDWFESSNPRVHYPALEPGRYRFEATLVDPDRGQSSAVVGLDFEVLPPWWRTGWFRALSMASGVLALLAAWRWQVRRLTARHRMEQELARERNVLLERASRDALTGLWNRASILDLFHEAIRSCTGGAQVGVAIIDVDHFKRVNDEHGHAAGDAVLKELAKRLSAMLRRSDLLGRYGGEELLLVLTDPGDPPIATVERLREAVCDLPFAVGARELPVTISVGVAWVESGEALEGITVPATAQDAFDRAEAALYEAKRSGRNRVVYDARSAGRRPAFSLPAAARGP